MASQRNQAHAKSPALKLVSWQVYRSYSEPVQPPSEILINPSICLRDLVMANTCAPNSFLLAGLVRPNTIRFTWMARVRWIHHLRLSGCIVSGRFIFGILVYNGSTRGAFAVLPFSLVAIIFLENLYAAWLWPIPSDLSEKMAFTLEDCILRKLPQCA